MNDAKGKALASESVKAIWGRWQDSQPARLHAGGHFLRGKLNLHATGVPFVFSALR